MGFFDLSRRYEGLDRKQDLLVMLASVVPWKRLRPKLRAAVSKHGLRKAANERKGAAGREPWDEVIIFKATAVQALYSFFDEQTEYQLPGRLSFMRFLGLGLEDAVPGATTLWLYREALSKAGLVEQLFAEFDTCLREHGYLARGRQTLMPRSSRPPSNATAGKTTKPSSRAGHRPSGNCCQPSGVNVSSSDLFRSC